MPMFEFGAYSKRSEYKPTTNTVINANVASLSLVGLAANIALTSGISVTQSLPAYRWQELNCY